MEGTVANFSLQIEPDGEEKYFSTFEEIRSFAESEKQFWAWIPTGGESGSYLQDLKRKVNSALDVISSCAVDAIRDPNSVENRKTRIVNTLKLSEDKNFLYSGSPVARFIMDLSETDPELAAFVLGAYLNFQPNQYLRFQLGVRALVEISIYERGISDNVSNEREALTRLRKDWSSKLGESIDEWEGFTSHAEETHEARKTELEELRSDYQQKFDADLAKNKAEMDKMKELYEKQLPLHSPVQYWDDKSKEHEKASKKVLRLIALEFIVFGLIIWGEIHSFLTSLASPDSLPEYWIIATLALSTLVGIWVIRLTIRIYLSNLHLQTDAAERRTMVMTYLALAKEGYGSTDKDRHLALEALFRRATSGIVKDEALPITIVEALTRLK